MLKKYGKEIIKFKWNEYIFLGIVKQDNNYKFTIDNKTIVDKLVKAMLITENVDQKVLDKIIKYAEKEKDEDLILKILKLIVNNNDFVNSEEYKEYFLSKVKEFNSLNKGIMGELLYNFRVERKIVNEYRYEDLKILLDNFRYSEFNRLDEYFLNDLFEKYLDDLRKLIKNKITDSPNKNLYNSYSHLNLTDCNNFNKERYNNLSLCMDILEKNHYYKISNYIHYLIGEYNEELGNDILKYLNENDKYETYSKVIDLCGLFDASTSCWKIFEFIISKVDVNDKILNEIDCLLFNTGVVSGEYGIANSFNNKCIFFKALKPKNKKVKEFVNKEIKRFKLLYQVEKNKVDKNLIKDETKYKLENEKSDD
jgi:hypothetical protein